MLFSVSLVLLGNFPYIQAGMNAALGIGYTAFLFKVAPYKETKNQIASVSAEVVLSLILLLVIYFLQTDFRTIDWLVENSVVYLVVAVIGFQSLVTICYFVFNKFWKKTENVSEVTRINATQNHLFFERRNQSKVAPEVVSPGNEATENSTFPNKITL